MAVYLPWIGYPYYYVSKSLLEECPQNIVGSFWVMYGIEGFETDPQDIPEWWLQIVLEKNQAQAIIDACESGRIHKNYRDPLYSGCCILVISDSSNPASLSYVVQDLRMLKNEGIYLLKIMAKYNIPAHTEVRFPIGFLDYRYDHDIKNPNYQYLSKSLKRWSVQVWEDYCSYLMAEDGQSMFASYIRKVNKFKDEVTSTIEKSSKSLVVLIEGETDPIYIKTALKLFDRNNILEKIDIEWVGSSTGKGKSINTGDRGLTNTRNFLVSNPQFLENKKILLLYDCDTKKQHEDLENLIIRTIPQIQDRKVKKGIENLFPNHLFKKEFYVPKTKIGDYGEENNIQEFQKMKFCKWVCEKRKNLEDFQDFKVIINFIEEMLKDKII